MSPKKILWLCSWYPNRLDPFDGDFIQRHAAAASLFHFIHVIHIVPDTQGQVTRKVHEEIAVHQQLTEQVVYFKKNSSPAGILLGGWKWIRLYKKAIRKYIEENGVPALVHVHVPMRAGLLALWMKKKYGVDYFLTEHLGIYNEVDELRYEKRAGVYRHLLKKILSGAARFFSVSRYLGEGVNKLVMEKKFEVIPNVVDDAVFFQVDKPAADFTFIHVSNMVALKNVKGILDAFALLHSKLNGVKFIMIGNRDDDMKIYAQSLSLADAVSFHGEIPHVDVAKKMQGSDALVIFSDIENAPCVISEAICCGLPVIATAVGGIPGMINEQNGKLVPPRDVHALYEAMQEMINNKQAYNGQEIAAKARALYGVKNIAGLFNQAYEEYFSKKIPL
jgi:glycosyltransferase involved in cell wall biosynthesis